jgi:DNA-binding NarL/FixJ family response regulator
MDRLTPTEIQVIRVVATGASNREVGERLGRSWMTVRAQLHQILTKLQLANRTQLAVWACRNGVLEEES